MSSQPTAYQVRDQPLKPPETRALLADYAAARDAHGAESREAIAVRNRIVTGNLGLVFSVARRFGRIDHADILGVGVPGLIKAIERFDLAKGCAFSTYAVWWIRYAISRYIDDQGGVVRLPVHVQSASSKAGPECLEAAAAARRMMSLDAVIGEEWRETFKDVLEDSDALAAFDVGEQHQLAQLARAELAKLPERERVIVERRAEGHHLAEIGRDLGLSRERTRQLEQTGLGRLRRALRDAA